MKEFSYLKVLLGFAFRKNPLLYLALAITVGSVVLELCAMALLLPLSKVAAGQSLSASEIPVVSSFLKGDASDGRVLLILFIVLFALRIISQFVGQALVLLLSKRLLWQMTTGAFHNLLTMVPLKQIERASIGSYIALAGDESFRASMMITYLSQLAAQALLGGLYFFVIWRYSGSVALAVVLFFGICMLLMYQAFRTSHRLGNLQTEQSHAANSLILDALNGLRSVRAHSAEKFVSESYQTSLKRYTHTLFLVDLISLLTRLGPALLLFAVGLVLVVFPQLLGNQFDSFPFLVTIIIFLLRFFPVVGQALTIALRVISDARAGRDVTQLIALDTTPDDVAKLSLGLGPVQKIQVSGVSFSHGAGVQALDKLSFELHQGQSYALVGKSGSGKSTLMDLLLGFYPADVGRVLIDDVRLEDLSLQALRQRVLLVAQETTIFNDTVRNNICFGMDATDAQVMRACRVACMDDFLEQLPQGLQTPLNYRGTNLSGGQRQRIGLARALLRQPPVLLLDESTSALDAETREKVVRNLLAEYRDRILVFVTHDARIVAAVDGVLDLSELNRAQTK